MSLSDFNFHTTVRVRFHETDLQGHVNFIWHQSYFSIAMAEYLKAIEYSYARLNELGIDMLFVDAHSSFFGPAFYDQDLDVHCRVDRIGTTSVRFAFETVRTEDGGLVATGDVTVVTVDRKSREKTPVPDDVRAAVAAFENSV